MIVLRGVDAHLGARAVDGGMGGVVFGVVESVKRAGCSGHGHRGKQACPGHLEADWHPPLSGFRAVHVLPRCILAILLTLILPAEWEGEEPRPEPLPQRFLVTGIAVVARGVGTARQGARAEGAGGARRKGVVLRAVEEGPCGKRGLRAATW